MEYKFRGKRKDNREWVYGFYISAPALPLADSKHFIIEFVGIESGEPIFDWHEVIAETVGLYSGWKDKNGNPIYQDDMLRGVMHEQGRDNNTIRIEQVIFDRGGFTVFNKSMQLGRGKGKGTLDCFLWFDKGNLMPDQYWQIDSIEIVGNIHEVNPASGQSGINNMLLDPNEKQAAEGQEATAETLESASQDKAMEVDSEEGTTEG